MNRLVMSEEISMLGTMKPFKESPLNRGHKAQIVRSSIVALINEEFDCGMKPWLTMRVLANTFAVDMADEHMFGDITLQENSLGSIDERHYYLEAIEFDERTFFLYFYGKKLNDGILCVRWVKTQKPQDGKDDGLSPKTLFKEN